MNLEEAKGIVETTKDVDTRNNLTKSAKTLLPCMVWLIEQAERAVLWKNAHRENSFKYQNQIQDLKRLLSRYW